MTRVAAIGLDAAEWWLVDKLIAEGKLPHLAALRQRSVECVITMIIGTCHR